MILFGLRDIGPANACLPVFKILNQRGLPVVIYAEGPAAEYLKNKTSFVTRCKITDLLDSVRPSLVVITPSTIGGAIPISLINEAKKRNLPVILFEDLWSGHSCSEWNVLPDAVCVVDSFAKKLVRESWLGYPESNIHITGGPVFDKFVNIQTGPAGYKLRKTLDLSKNWPVIFFPGEVFGMTQAVQMLVEALNGLNVPVYLILRDHLKITSPEASDEYKQIYLEYCGALKNLKAGIVINSSKLTSDEVNSGSDVVVGICSTMLVEACYMCKPVLHIWTPEIGQALFEVASNTFAEMPTTNLGAALKAESVEEIKG
ncbi:MAG: hypothetical protein HYT63_02590 [Candidatus Yanofskybacteria bacterium]|nr:hypothetical protein [Candidatus Yanofskybacteria bacterium]